MKETWNQAEISEDIRQVNYVDADRWNPAELNEIVNQFGISYPVDTWNPAELNEKANNIINDIISTKTISGNPIQIKTVNGGKVKSCVISFSPVQSGSGDPSPENVRPISGWTELSLNQCGKNFWSYGNISGTKQVDKQVNVPAGDWAFSCEITSDDVDGTTSLIIFYYDDDTSFLTRLNRNSRVSYTFTATKPIKRISFYAGYNSSQSAGDAFTYSNIQLELGSQATTYEPYQGTTHTATLGSTYYGGKLDMVSGKLKSEWDIVDLSTLSWNYDSIGKRWQTNGLTTIKSFSTRSVELISDRWKADITAQAGDEYKMFTVGKGLYFYTTDSVNSPTGTLVYPLATPQEITLTAEEIELLSGANVMWTDGDSIELKYTKLALPDDENLDLRGKLLKAIQIISGKDKEETKETKKKKTTKKKKEEN